MLMDNKEIMNYSKNIKDKWRVTEFISAVGNAIIYRVLHIGKFTFNSLKNVLLKTQLYIDN